MRKIIVLVLIIKLNVGCSQGINVGKYKAEPKSVFEVLLNGKKFTVSEDEVLKTDTLLKPVISIKEMPYKKFENAVYSFSYPKNFSYEYSEGDLKALETWTLSGNNVVVMMFEMYSKVSLKELMDEMIKRFGVANCKMENLTKKLGDKEFNGKSLRVTLVGQHLLLEYYPIKLENGHSSFLILQDTIEDIGHSKEYADTFKALDTSIFYK